MSDAFADLWNSTGPAKPAAQPATQPTASQSRPKNDLFSMLSSAASSAPSSRPLTPSVASSAMKPVDRTPKPPTGDAFSGLLSGTFTSSPHSSANLTIAERTAKAERERREAILKSQNTPSQPLVSSAWDGLDSLGQFSSASKQQLATSAPLEDDWGLDDFTSPPQVAATSQRPDVTHEIWDVNEFDAPPPSQAAQVNSPEDSFDFGDRENGLLDGHHSDEDEILGVLSKPVAQSKPMTSISSPSPRSTNSPPPHIVGQLVEMGFSVTQAKTALAATETGVEVQAALDFLLANDAARPSPSSQRSSHPIADSRPRSRLNQGPTRPDRETPSPSKQESGFQNQADKLFAQAGELGLSLFNRMKESSKRVQQVYLENFAESSTTAEKENRRKVPRWMQQGSSEHLHDQEPPHLQHNAFLDEATPALQTPQPQRQPPVQRPPPNENVLTATTPYVSRFRRGKVNAADLLSTTQQETTQWKNPKPRESQPPTPQPRQNVISASLSSISQSQSYKASGGDKFKLGQYGEAEAAYTRAIECLPSRHLLLVHLYNNRALARMKTGDYTGAIGDSGVVIEIIGEGWRPGRELPITKQEEGAGVDLGDGLTKAWKRRAEALEGKEKWEDAKKDWEKVAGAEWAAQSVRSEGVRGAGRCRRMAEQATDNQSAPKPVIRATPVPQPPTRRGPTPPSEALSKLREANNAAEAEDQAKHDLKDVVDNKLLAWKGGKETNIRALLASLDSILWPELGLQQCSMADLVTPSQVKIRYTKAIAKVHPDKLNEKNSNIEQRLVAQGVFGTLNEAWNAFKQ